MRATSESVLVAGRPSYLSLASDPGPDIGSLTVTGADQSAAGNNLSAVTQLVFDLYGRDITYTYQWYKADDAAGTGEILLTGEESSTYTLLEADEGKFFAVEATPTNSDGQVGDTVKSSYAEVVFAPQFVDYTSDTYWSSTIFTWDGSKWAYTGTAYDTFELTYSGTWQDGKIFTRARIRYGWDDQGPPDNWSESLSIIKAGGSALASDSTPVPGTYDSGENFWIWETDLDTYSSPDVVHQIGWLMQNCDDLGATYSCYIYKIELME